MRNNAKGEFQLCLFLANEKLAGNELNIFMVYADHSTDLLTFSLHTNSTQSHPSCDFLFQA